MRIFNIKLRLLTPAIVSASEGYRGMLYMGARDKILGSTVRGALMAWGIREGVITHEDVNREVMSPKHVITTFLLSRGEDGEVAYRDVRIAHALTFKFKDGLGRDHVHSLGIDELLSIMASKVSPSPSEVLHELLAKVSMEIDSLGNELLSSTNTERVLGSSLVREGGNWVLAGKYLVKGSYVGTGVDRERRSVIPGVLFGYEYVDSGTTFVGTLMCSEDSVMCELVESLIRSKALVSVGKGVGRGYGLARVEVREVGKEVFDEVKIREGSYLVFEVINPLVTYPISDNEPPIPRPAVINDVIKSCIEGRCLELKVVAIYGDILRFSGWSLRLESPKLPMKALSHGSLLITKVGGDLSVLKEIPLVPTEPKLLSTQGLNLLQPIPKDFIPTYGGD